MQVQMKKPRKNSKADLNKRTYTSWSNMLLRCYNPKHQGYPEYGGRGIKVYGLWRPDFYETLEPADRRAAAYSAFLRRVGYKPTWKHTLDRIDANGHYVPDNVKWATHKEQGVNKRNTHFVKHPTTGQRICAATLADELKITYHQLRARMIRAGSWYELRFESGSKETPLT
jgi:hypothetical protein